jgi:hypothetical protein
MGKVVRGAGDCFLEQVVLRVKSRILLVVTTFRGNLGFIPVEARGFSGFLAL